MMSVKKYVEKNVFEMSQERIKLIFDEFENILIAFSGGKDSGVCLNLFYDYAKKTNQLHKLNFYHQDYEAGYNFTRDYCLREFENKSDVARRFWLCLPINAQCSVSMFQEFWTPWDENKKEIWVNDMPDEEWVIHEHNVPYVFEKGTYGGVARRQFSKWFASEFGKSAVIVGLRGDESLSRLAVITSQHRTHMYKDIRYSKKVNDDTYNFYPIYDWRTEDIWIANAKFEWDYNKMYDLFYQAGVPLDSMRTASPFHMSGQDTLKLFKTIEPQTWSKMVSRVNGVNFTGIYGGTTAMGWRNIKKPEHFTWEQYAKFLIKTLPKDFKERIEYNITRIMNTWENDGYGRNPRVIKTMEDEGVILEKTGVDDPRCTKPGFYEIVKIKSGMPDETSEPMFRKVPSWKGVCITILKNDFTCQYMGVSRSDKDMAKRREAMKKYKAIL
ncbi:DUF3440 domain-containing protein [Macrococcoides canis]|uniref:DUF3440 domain-containing protein n=1 Tax=Macrococcoides canis TaxID=1855823 RepID=A0AAE6X246_9STAP|nr:DUF3440 domain-containing protein [Macrococcus canis]QIH78332.1 DUF3440 domain-containing protein [Macrococcus canis]